MRLFHIILELREAGGLFGLIKINFLLNTNNSSSISESISRFVMATQSIGKVYTHSYMVKTNHNTSIRLNRAGVRSKASKVNESFKTSTNQANHNNGSHYQNDQPNKRRRGDR